MTEHDKQKLAIEKLKNQRKRIDRAIERAQVELAQGVKEKRNENNRD